MCADKLTREGCANTLSEKPKEGSEVNRAEFGCGRQGGGHLHGGLSKNRTISQTDTGTTAFICAADDTFKTNFVKIYDIYLKQPKF